MKEQEGFFTTGSHNTTVTISSTAGSGSSWVMYPNSTDNKFPAHVSLPFVQILEYTPSALRFKKLHEDAKAPVKAHDGDLAYDLFALEDVTLRAGQVTKIKTGIACGFPKGYGAVLRDRSSVATKQEAFVVAGVIDNGYVGEIIVAMFNPLKATYIEDDSDMDFTTHYYEQSSFNECEVCFNKGDKIAQMILTPVITFPVEEVQTLDNTDRGDAGFGSTGI